MVVSSLNRISPFSNNNVNYSGLSGPPIFPECNSGIVPVDNLHSIERVANYGPRRIAQRSELVRTAASP